MIKTFTSRDGKITTSTYGVVRPHVTASRRPAGEIYDVSLKDRKFNQLWNRAVFYEQARLFFTRGANDKGWLLDDKEKEKKPSALDIAQGRV